MHTSSFKIGILKVQDFGIFELSPMFMSCVVELLNSFHCDMNYPIYIDTIRI